MTRKINRLEDYISSTEAASILSEKYGRFISPDYVRKLRNVRSHKANGKCHLYHRSDIEAVVIRKRTMKKLPEE
jgi:dissimilatory sulfite reductase (desulfoviridin) alpha/beta subunit